MLKVIFIRLNPQAEEIFAEEHAGQSRKKHHITDIQPQNLCEKYLQHQQNLHHVFKDLKKNF